MFLTYTNVFPLNMDVSKNRGTQNGWFIMEHPIKMDDLGGTIIFGNTYTKRYTDKNSMGTIGWFWWSLAEEGHPKESVETMRSSWWWIEKSGEDPAYGDTRWVEPYIVFPALQIGTLPITMRWFYCHPIAYHLLPARILNYLSTQIFQHS